MDQQLKKIGATDIRLGEPLRFSVYDQLGTLLLRKGIVVSIPAQIERLVKTGCYVDLEEITRDNAGFSPTRPIVQQAVSPFVRAEECCAKLKSLFVSLLRMPDQTDATARSREIAGAIREACLHNASGMIASLQVESNISYLASHQIMGAVLVEQVGKLAGFSDDDRLILAAAALTRDLGMVALQANLDKIHGPLPEQLLAQVHAHPASGADLLKRAGVKNEMWLQAVEQHHERIDGTGYPRGLQGDGILKGARLLGICDIFSAMIKPRPYRQYGRAKIPQSALRDIFTMSGKTLDQEYAAMLIKTVGVIPPGSIVKLKNNEIALVAEIISNPKAGKVLTIYDRNQMPVIEPAQRDTSLPEYEIVGMARHDECRPAQLIIKNILMKG